MSKVRSKNNATTEKRFRAFLIMNGISGWILHPKEIIGKPDIYFTEYSLAIFLDGCFWHGCPKCGHIPKTNTKFWHAKIQRNIERDKEINKKLRKQGIKIIRFWEHDIITKPIHCIHKVEKYL